MATNTEADRDPEFRPALIIVDLQTDFCPPDGSLAIAGGRETIAPITELARLPGFVTRIATQDYHPANHVSFATNHPPPHNKPFTSYIDMSNWVPGKESETVRQRLWPVHCVQGTEGAEFASAEVTGCCDVVVRKGMSAGMEMYSVFADAFATGGGECVAAGGVSHDCVSLLREKRVTDVFVVGLAGDYCVRDTALDARRVGGFKVCVVREGVRCVDPEKGWEGALKGFAEEGVRVVKMDGPEVRRVRELATG